MLLVAVQDSYMECGYSSLLIAVDENRDSPERDMVNPSTDSYMWPIRGAP